MADMEALSYVGFSSPARLHERPRKETDRCNLGLHCPPCLASLHDPKISLQTYIYIERERSHWTRHYKRHFVLCCQRRSQALLPFH